MVAVAGPGSMFETNPNNIRTKANAGQVVAWNPRTAATNALEVVQVAHASRSAQSGWV